MKTMTKSLIYALVLMLPAVAGAQYNKVINIFTQEIDSVTAVTITADEKVHFSSFTLDSESGKPNGKVVIDIQNALLETDEKALEAPVGPIGRLRSSQWLTEPAVVRVVADLRTESTYRIQQEDNQIYLIFSNYGETAEPARIITQPQQSQVQSTQAAVTNLNIRGQTIGQVIEAFTRLYHMNIITSKTVDRTELIDVMIKEFRDPVMLFETILIANDYKYVKRDNIFLVTGREAIIEDEYEVKIFKLKYLDANDIITQLEPLKSASGQISAYSRRAIGSTDLAIPTQTGGGGGGASGTTQMNPLQSFQGLEQETGTEEQLDRSNTLIVYETPDRIKKIKKVIEELDKPTPQVNIAVKLVETSLGDNEKWGINWTSIIEAVGAGGQPTGSMQAGAGGANDPEGPIVPGIQLKANNFRFGTISFNQFKAVLQLLESQEDSKLLNQPSITTLDNQEANIAVGKIIPIEVTQVGMGGASGGAGGGGAAGGAGGGLAAITTIQPQTVAIALSVVPQVNENKYITLYVKPVVQEIAGYTGKNGELPITSTRSTTTQVRVKDGDVIIIGGLIKEDKLKVNTRVKFLHKLPFLGRMFKHTRIETVRSELVIFITPNIIKDHAIITADAGTGK